MLLYELFTGQSPFLAPNAAAILESICAHRQTPAREVNPGLPEGLSELIDRLLKKEPGGRPQSASEVALALAEIAAGGAGEPPPAGAAPRALVAPSFEATTLPPGPTAGQAAAERRQVTALWCGLAGSAAAEPRDPEDLLDEIAALQELVAEVVGRYEGQLGPLHGSGWLAYFGFPRAHEDDARRAVSAALEITARARRTTSGAAAGEAAPALRAGIHTGAMVVKKAAGASGEDLALSYAGEIAARLPDLVHAGAVLVSQPVVALVAGFFSLEELVPVALPGGARPLGVYRVAGASAAQTRLDAAPSHTPLVGREQELGLLLQRSTLAREGRGQVVLLAGEAGLGKSRLVWELRQRLRDQDLLWLEGHGSPYHRGSVLFPIVQWLEQSIGADREDPPETKLVRLEHELARLRLPLAEVVLLLAPLLAIP